MSVYESVLEKDDVPERGYSPGQSLTFHVMGTCFESGPGQFKQVMQDATTRLS